MPVGVSGAGGVVGVVARAGNSGDGRLSAVGSVVAAV